MRTRLINNPDRDAGFTLVELMVVIIIIGILAAIAIPVFFAQRSKGADAASKSDLANFANFEEIYLNDNSAYGTLANVIATEPHVQASVGVTVTLLRYNGNKSYCMSAKSNSSNQTWYYDSLGGGLQPSGSTGCPVTITGTVGDSVTG